MNKTTFETKLAQLINQESIDNALDIPDYLLAELIESQLRAAAAAHKIRKYKKEKPPFENGAIFSKIEEDLFKGWDLKKPSRAFCETITPARVQELAKVVEKFIKEAPGNLKEEKKFKSPKDFLREYQIEWTETDLILMQEYAKEFHNFMMQE